MIIKKSNDIMRHFLKFSTIFSILIVLLTVIRTPAAATTTKTNKYNTDKRNEEFPEEDVDMLMEANDFAPISLLHTRERNYQQQEPPTSIATSTRRFRQILNPRIFQARRSGSVDSHTQAAQNYYPPFFREVPPLGHSRPYFQSPDGTLLTKFNEQRSSGNLGPQQRSLNYDQSILGSGDFGIIRGGTFYPEEELPYHTEDNLDFVQKYTYPEEQFAQFRDFADINTPVDSAFSQYVVIYENAKQNDNLNDNDDANNNITGNNNNIASQTISRKHPKNIFEQLELLDREMETDKASKERKESKDNKKKKNNGISKSKAKLAKTKLDLKKYNKKKTIATATATTTATLDTKNDIDDIEPLLALS